MVSSKVIHKRSEQDRRWVQNRLLEVPFRVHGQDGAEMIKKCFSDISATSTKSTQNTGEISCNRLLEINARAVVVLRDFALAHGMTDEALAKTMMSTTTTEKLEAILDESCCESPYPFNEADEMSELAKGLVEMKIAIYVPRQRRGTRADVEH